MIKPHSPVFILNDGHMSRRKLERTVLTVLPASFSMTARRNDYSPTRRNVFRCEIKDVDSTGYSFAKQSKTFRNTGILTGTFAGLTPRNVPAGEARRWVLILPS